MRVEQPKPSSEDHDSRRDRAELVERLFREHNEALVRFLQARLRSPQEAREVAQEAYVRLLSLDESGAVSYLRSFLFKTAENLAVDRLRRGATYARMTSSPLFREFEDVRTPERHAAASQSLERLQRLIAALPPKCRQAFVLYQLNGQEFEAVAQEMKLSVRMVRVYVVRALLYCREGMDRDEGLTGESRND